MKCHVLALLWSAIGHWMMTGRTTRLTSNGDRMTRTTLVTIMAIFAAAFAVRLAVVAQTCNFPTARHLIGDAAGYHAWALQIAAGDWVGSRPFYQAPLYPYVLGALFHLSGSDVWKIRVFQCLLGAAAAVLMWLAGKRLFDSATALCAAALISLYPPAIFFDGIVQKTSLTNVLVCGLLATTASHYRSRSAVSALAAGLLLAALCITRENAMVWLPVVLVWLIWLHSRGTDSERIGDTEAGRGVRSASGQLATALGLFIVGLALVLAPVAIRNRAVGGEWAISTFQAGPNFYIGNHGAATGRYVPLVPGHETPQFERDDAKRLAEQASGQPLTSGEVSRYWMSRALDDIRAEPLRWLSLLGRKLLMTLNRYEVADAESVYAYADASPVLRVLGALHFGVIAPLATAGLIATWPMRRRLWLLYALAASMTLAVAAFYVLARYRYPLAPILILFAGAGLVHGWRSFKAGTPRRLLAPLTAGMMVAVVVNVPVHDERRLDALARMNIGVALAQAGELQQAAEYFAAAVREHPGSAEAHSNLAQALAISGDFARAIPHYEQAVAIRPDLPGIWFNYGVALEQTGRIDQAHGAYSRAIAQSPWDADARQALQRIQR